MSSGEWKRRTGEAVIFDIGDFGVMEVAQANIEIIEVSTNVFVRL